MQRRNEGRGAGGTPVAWLAGALACALAAPAFAQGKKPTVEELLSRLEALEQRYGGQAANQADGATTLDLAALDQRLRVLERNLELQEEARVAKEKEAPVVAVNDKGASFKSASGDYELRFRGLLQGDGRFYNSGVPAGTNDTFLLRTARPIFEGTLGKWVGYRFTPEFAGDSATIVDAYADLKFSPAATVRLGKFTSPVGLERLQSSSALSAVERGIASELAPNRDIGVQLQGDLGGGRASYAIGVYNGAVDGRDAPSTNPDDDFEYGARLFFEPFRNDASAWSGLGFGIGASVGDTHGSGNNFLPRYRTPGQVQFFNYRGTVAADGRRTRWSPQAYYYRNRFGLLAEYIESAQEVRLGADTAELDNTAWQATASWVLTGEDASYRGVVKPSRPLSPGKGGWGAWELVGRYGELDVDDGAFPLFADPAVAARSAQTWTVGVNWYLNSNLKLVANYLQTGFDGGAAAGADRTDEKAVFTRLQVAF
ncbi:OprO/OprP family phosphate-selective porin [Pseudoxanthomonas koreensis]|uniref:OprO/OprP family phosphate-selective porin n=1 Tax=Pseudoxanthomonas koreensis TaxID=266061 RepID=UPI001391C6EC|nr:porin [Pseudoxanthomonas koreensis]KAF1691110.1 porin [Pseudoxanthomonas koreensis]